MTNTEAQSARRQKFDFSVRAGRLPDKAFNSDLSFAEEKRRRGAGDLHNAAAELDRKLLQILESRDLPEKDRDRLNILSTLSTGEEKKDVDDPRATPITAGAGNQIERRCYVGHDGKDVWAYAKPRKGETFIVSVETERNEAIALSTSARVIYLARRMFNRQTGNMDIKYVGKPTDSNRISALQAELVSREQVENGIRDFYGLSLEEFKLSRRELPLHPTLDVGMSCLREYVFARIAMLLNFDVVPPTVLRAEENNIDIASVQQAIEQKDGRPLSVMTEAVFNEMYTQGPKHAAARSIMRLASLDYLCGSQDRGHVFNMVHDAYQQKLWGIDNGACLGFSGVDQEQQNIRGSRSKNAQKVNSIPLEITRNHNGWLLDDNAQLYTHSLYENYKDRKAEFKILTHLFHIAFSQHSKIADMELSLFIQRLERLAQYKRPPNSALERTAKRQWPVGLANTVVYNPILDKGVPSEVEGTGATIQYKPIDPTSEARN